MKLSRAFPCSAEADPVSTGRFSALNFRRMTVVSCIVFATHLPGLFALQKLGGGLLSLRLAIAAFAAAYALLSYHMYRGKSAPPFIQRILPETFWYFFSLSMLPYYIAPRFMSAQIVVAVTCAVLISAQIYSSRQILFHFSFNAVAGMCAAALTRADMEMYDAVLIINMISLALALSVHRDYFRIVGELYHDAQTDDLTGLLNRRAGTVRTKALWKQCGRMQGACAALMMDIDFFKSYNDAFGHLRGDAVLVSVARVLKTSFSRSTDVVCRLGGEEFLVCASVKDEGEALMLAYSVLKRVEELKIQTAPNGISEHITISIGVSVRIPEKDQAEQMLLEDADKSLYAAKSGGRNSIAIDGRLA